MKCSVVLAALAQSKPTLAARYGVTDLALFGSTPRTEGERAAGDVGEALMSRGAAEALAEVIFSKFEGGERARYRARWMVARAHKRADGKLQAVQRSLERRDPATGAWALLTSGAKQKDTDPVFRDALDGFTVKDFQRSMLLAA